MPVFTMLSRGQATSCSAKFRAWDRRLLKPDLKTSTTFVIAEGQGKRHYQVVEGIGAISIELGVTRIGAVVTLAAIRMVLDCKAGAALGVAAWLAILAIVSAFGWCVGVGVRIAMCRVGGWWG